MQSGALVRLFATFSADHFQARSRLLSKLLMMCLTLSAIALLCLVGSAHSKSSASFHRGARVPTISIVGGTPAAEGEFPYVVVLRLNGYLCAGSLIGPSHVLTAAHCLSLFNQTDVAGFYLLINTLNVDGGGPNSVVKRVKKFIIHPRFKLKTYNNDVALLVLSSPVAANSTFVNLPTEQAATTSLIPAATTSRLFPSTSRKPPTTTKSTKKPTIKSTVKPTTTKLALRPTIKSTTKNSAVLRAFSAYTNVRATIAGWGTTSFGGSISSTLLKANVTILANSKCDAQYGTTFIGANILCAAAPGTDTCQVKSFHEYLLHIRLGFELHPQGDSGGPVLVNRVVVGITSFGVGCADPKYAGIYTRVSTYVSWIKTTMLANNPG